MQKIPAVESKSPKKAYVFLIYIALAVSTFIAYESVRLNDFVNFDDREYVCENSNVYKGITYTSVVWAFTRYHSANWHPVTWISHMLDCELFGLNPAGHHIVNLLIHIANTLLLFWIFRKMTGRLRPSFFVAAVFALHPVHVESVAWIAERKDVLSGFFWMLTIAAYLMYAQRPGIKRYMFVVLALALSLMSKPMAVTLPFVLLLLDFWPLNRFATIPPQKNEPNSAIIFQKASTFALIKEKLPLLLLVAASCIITFIVQQKAGAVKGIGAVSFNTRFFNAGLSYVRYIAKSIYPTNLAVFYPYYKLIMWQPLVCVLLLACITILAVITVRNWRYLIVGWLWYLGTLFPVIGLVQVGGQSFADRYTYLSTIGITMMIAFAVERLFTKKKFQKISLTIIYIFLIVGMIVITRKQVATWKNTTTLFEHALKVTNNNYIAHTHLAGPLLKENKNQQAFFHINEAIRINPGYARAQVVLGHLLTKTGKNDQAIAQLKTVLQKYPNNAYGHIVLGIAFGKKGQLDQAITNFEKALKIKPGSGPAQVNLGLALINKGDLDEGIKYLSNTLSFEPDSFLANLGLAIAFSKKSDFNRADEYCEKALQIDPNSSQAWGQFASSLLARKKFDESVEKYFKAIELNPDWPEVLNNLAWLLATHKDAEFYDPQKALKFAQKACELDEYSNPGYMDSLAVAYAANGDFKHAIKISEKAIEKASALGQTQTAKEIQKHLEFYKNGKPYFE